MPVMILRRLLTALAFLVAGFPSVQAAQNGGYPSLAKRPIESAGTRRQEQAAAPVAAPAPDPALIAEVQKLKDDAQSGATAFDGAFAEAQRSVNAAAGSDVSSEAWVVAQQSISALDAARNASVSALASLDVMYIDRLNAIADGKVAGGDGEIDSARIAALAIVDAQNDRLDAIKARLRQP